jgi:peroxiredoxin
MLQPGAVAPDFPVGARTLYELLGAREVAVFFFPKAFTPG